MRRRRMWQRSRGGRTADAVVDEMVAVVDETVGENVDDAGEDNVETGKVRSCWSLGWRYQMTWYKKTPMQRRKYRK